MRTIAFQGEPGAYSHAALHQLFPSASALPCLSFQEALAAVSQNRADACVLPIENSVAGRVAELHRLLPDTSLYITGEYFHPIDHMLLALPGTSLPQIQEVWSHPQALAQCRHALEELGVQPIAHRDTAGAAKLLKEENLNRVAVLASRKAAEIYGLDVLASSLQDRSHNATRFIVLEREQPRRDPESAEQFVTTLLFQLRSVPAALYKALGGFATNGVNLTRIESHLHGGSFAAAQFFIDAEGHPEEVGMQRALEELRFFCEEDGVRILGTYPRGKRG